MVLAVVNWLAVVAAPLMLIAYVDAKSAQLTPDHFSHLLLAETQRIVPVAILVAVVRAGSKPMEISSIRASISVTKLAYVLVRVGKL
jgi:hypothetical protein